jgi:hypothetical protein
MAFTRKPAEADDRQAGTRIPPGLRAPVRTRQASGGRGVRDWCVRCDESPCICRAADREAGG